MDAVAYLRRVQQAHPGDFYANNMLGNALIEMEQFGDAVGYFRAALALRPGATVARGNLGYSLLVTQQWDEARVVNEELIRIDPANGWAHVSLGEVLRRQGHTDLAIEHLQRALPLVEPSSRPHRALAFALQERQRWGEAIHHLRKAAAISPDKAWHQYDLGMALNSPGNQDEAIEYLRKTLALDPRYPAARVNLTRILFDRGRADEGIAELWRAIELDPTDTFTLQGLEVLKDCGKLEELQLPGVSDRALEALHKIDRLKCLVRRPTVAQGGPGAARGAGLLDLSSLFTNPSITDASMPLLTGLKGVTDLRLAKTAVTNAGAAYIGKMAGLQAVDLTYAKVDNGCLRGLTGLTDLVSLRASGSGGAGGEPLSAMKLEFLGVSNPKAGLTAQLKAMPKLRFLELDSVDSLTDADVDALCQISGLESLVIAGSGFPRGMGARLEKALPKAKIRIYQ